MAPFNPEKDIPDLSGQVILVTGGTAGLGAQTVLLLAAHNPAHVYFTGRSAAKANEVISEAKSKFPSVSVTFIELDLASLASVQAGAKKFLNTNTRLDKLICNAGVMALPPGLTKDGYEIQFGTNHMGHALLVKLLIPTMIETAKQPGTDVRVVFLSSEGATSHPFGGIIFKDLKTPQSFTILGPWQRYGQSKLANVLFTAELARRYKDSGILFLSVHPGVFNTGLVKELGWGQRALVWGANLGRVKDEKKEGQGAWNTCWAATAKKTAKGNNIVNGEFYFPVGEPGKKIRDVSNAKLAGELYEWTEKELENWK